jgi:hypothetical protein
VYREAFEERDGRVEGEAERAGDDDRRSGRARLEEAGAGLVM